MKRIYLAFQIALVSLLAVMSTTAMGLASNPVRSPFSAEILASGQPLDPGRSWVGGNGIMHVRGMVLEGTITGDIDGEVLITQDMNLDATFTGNVHVKAVITADSGAVYEMLAYVIVTNNALSGTFMIHGTESLRGTHMMGTVGGVGGGVATLNGYQFTAKP